MALGILGLNSVLNISLAIHSILQAADKVKSFNVESDVRVIVTENVLNVPSCTVVGLVADKPIVYNEPIGSIFIVWLGFYFLPLYFWLAVVIFHSLTIWFP